MARQLQENGEWVEVKSSKDSIQNNISTKGKPDNTGGEKVTTDVGDTDVGSKTKNKQTKEEFVLEGEAEVYPDPTIKAKTTVTLKGLGKYLSGTYYVKKVTHRFSGSDGYSQSLTLVKNGFNGNTIKNSKNIESRREKINK